MSNYRRNRVPGGTYFFTVNLLERDKTLLTDHIKELRIATYNTRQKMPFHIDGWVVLPDHLHSIWTLPKSDSDYSGRWREIKKSFSKLLPNKEYLSPVRIKRKERGIWQRRFWEHTIRDELDYQRHMDYLHYNPFKHCFVDTVNEWPYSTFHHLVKQGVYPENWSGSHEELNAGERK